MMGGGWWNESFASPLLSSPLRIYLLDSPNKKINKEKKTLILSPCSDNFSGSTVQLMPDRSFYGVSALAGTLRVDRIDLFFGVNSTVD